jgi:hypothetical protein
MEVQYPLTQGKSLGLTWLVILMGNKAEEPSIDDFEQERFPCAKEWWCVEGFFTAVEGGKQWSFKADFYQAIIKRRFQASYSSLTIFDLTDRKKYYYYAENDFAKLVTKQNPFNVQFDSSYISKPDAGYELNFVDKTHNISLKLDVHAASTPYWVAKQMTDGWLPWGFGYYRYGFIPKNTIEGTLYFQNKKYVITGKGYLEHAWGDFSYLTSPSTRRSLTKIVSVYAKLIGWWVHNHEFTIPKSLALSTDNRPPGYDWFWAILDNGWSLFYGNVVFWITEGPATGTLIVSKDGEHYDEFSDIHFKYNQMKYVEKYDFYYPTDLELIARKGHETLTLHIANATESTENVFELENGGRYLGLLISQVPSTINGYYTTSEEKIALTGDAKLESNRLLTIYGHTSVKFKITFTEKQRAIASCFHSHYFGKNLKIDVQFLPRPRLKIKYTRLKKPQGRQGELKNPNRGKIL